ncbi:MAG: hybrid sensor histidine kinase/response regulator [Cyanobacteria bacterium J055]|nr:MAG: hybrid sensor histidine kinase/response regulator [Cyanobacteria bacterium J055]
MNRFSFIPSSRNLKVSTFEKVRYLLLQQIDAARPQESIVLTEEDLDRSDATERYRFLLVISRSFSALLLGQPDGNNLESYQVQLTFYPQLISLFLSQIPLDLNTLETAQNLLQPNNLVIQSDFTLLLIEALETDELAFLQTPNTLYPAVSVCKPVEDALSEHVTKERLLNQVTAQTHQRLQLPEILENAIAQVRDFLEIDRIAIYQLPNFGQNLQEKREESDVSFHPRIAYEVRANDLIPSLISQQNGAEFAAVDRYQELYCRGFILAIDDLEMAENLPSNLTEILQVHEVRSQLVVPIVVQTQLWGFLIAHHCWQPHHWQQSEKDFLYHISEHLGVAIYQAQLYAEVQQQKQSLEQQVNERTQALRDALVAAQAASRFKSEFLATMSHELRTPLTCVIGMSSTLLRWSFGQLSAKQRHYLQTIYSSGEHLLELINDILEFSELEAGHAILNITEFSLSQLSRHCVQMLADKAVVEGVDLQLEVSVPVEKDRFRADRERTIHILFNLLSNAVKFTPQGGRVVLRVSVEGDCAVFTVEDTGIGIPDDRRPLLFQTFQQLDASYNRQYGGMGLGLALTKQLVDLHGGEIDVESAEGVGSKFTVRLPMQSLPEAKSASTFAKIARRERTTIASGFPQGNIVLIADREEEATLICDLLTAAGYQVVWMLEGSTALDKIALLQPIAAIVDWRLTGIDGFELVSALRQLPNTQTLKIILLADLTTPEERDRCLASGANECLAHPMEPEELLNKLFELLSAPNNDLP